MMSLLLEKKCPNDKIGFVYEWANSVNEKRYLDSHDGNPNDAYIVLGVAFKN